MKTAVVLLSSVLAACSSIGVTAPSGVEIKHSGVLAPGGPTVETVYWTDDAHVLFIGAKPGVFESLPDGRKPLKRFLMLWDTASGEVKKFADLGEYAGLCYDRGYVFYGYRKPSPKKGQPGESVIKAGLLGSEAEIHRRGSINPFSCREYDETWLKTNIGKGFWPLREEHGYWGAYQGRGRTETVLIKNEGGRRIEIPLKILYEPPPHWSEYARAYVFGRAQHVFSRSKTAGRMWLLQPNGETKEFDIPAGPWFGGSTGYDITKRGVFIFSHALANNGIGDAGGYVMEKGKKPQRFIEGYIHAFGISANGCNIAMSIRLKDGPRDSAEMVMANICSTSN